MLTSIFDVTIMVMWLICMSYYPVPVSYSAHVQMKATPNFEPIIESVDSISRDGTDTPYM